MRKWLVIVCGVFAVFSLLVLGFGYLLKSNEDAHQAYINKHATAAAKQQESLKKEARQKQQTEAVLIFVDNATNISSSSNKQRDLLLNNLTCVADSQCKIQEVQFSNGTCAVAINAIGAALLARYQGEKSDVGDCISGRAGQVARCLDNICTLAKS